MEQHKFINKYKLIKNYKLIKKYKVIKNKNQKRYFPLIYKSRKDCYNMNNWEVLICRRMQGVFPKP